MSRSATAYSAVLTTSEMRSLDEASLEADYVAGTAEEISSRSPLVPQDALLIPPVYSEEQVVGCYPGFAFCKFLPGIVETTIRVMLMVVLIAMLAMSLIQGLYAIVTIASVEFVAEGFMVLMHCLNPYCFNNQYNIFGAMDMGKCVVFGLIMLIYFILNIQEILDTDCGTYEDYSYSEDCGQQAYFLRIFVIVLEAICLILLVILFTWDAIYMTFNFKLKVPVPRSRTAVQHN